MNVLNSAQKYVHAGFSIIPLKQVLDDVEQSKRPAIPRWKEYQTRLATQEELYHWFGNGNEPRNVALVTGQVSGNIVVLDFDRPGMFERWAAAYPQIASITATAKTGKGYHVLLRLTTPPPGNYAPAYFQGEQMGETRGEGGYIVVWPSVHGSGAQYTWLHPPWEEIAEVESLESVGITKKPGRPQATSCSSPPPSIDNNGSSAYAEAAFKDELEKLASAGEGNRNNQLNASAFALGQLIAAGHLDRFAVERALQDTALAIGLTESEVSATIRSGIEAGMNEPRQIPKRETRNPHHPAQDFPGEDQVVEQDESPEIFDEVQLDQLIRNIADSNDRSGALRKVFDFLANIDDEFTLARLRNSVSKKLELGLREYDRLLKVAKSDQKQNRQNALAGSEYFIEGGRICRQYFDREGNLHAYSLCNFVATIVEDVIKDDGESGIRHMLITGKLATGAPLPGVEIPANKFSAMSWVVENWGTQAVVKAGLGTKDQLREAVQLLSEGVTERHVFTHLGWRVIDGRRIYLSASGAIGMEGIDVELEREFEHYNLPLTADNPTEAMKASLKFLDIAPLTVTVPLWAAIWLAPLAEIIYPNFVLWLFGTTGSKKSTLAALALNHFGEKFNDTLLPADWWATVNSLEKMAFLAKDALFVIDDYRPESDPFRRRELEASAARIVRHVGNRSGRGRLVADLSLRTTFRPRGLVLSTGEQLPAGRSVAARLFTVEMRADDVNLEQLSRCQGQSHRYPHALGGYVQLIASQWEHLEAKLPDFYKQLRQKYQMADAHARIAGALSAMFIGLEMGLQYALMIGALDEAGFDELREKGETALLAVAQAQAKRVVDEKPTVRFLTIIGDLLCQQRVALEDLNRRNTGIGGTPGNTDNAERLGWCDKEFVYLIPSATFNRVARYCASENYPFPTTERTLMKELGEEGYTISESERSTKRVFVAGKTERVLAIHIDTIRDFAPGELPTWTDYGN